MRRSTRSFAAGLVCVAASLCAGWAAGASYVVPVVVGGVRGMNGSFWDSELRILQLSATQPVSVRRAWVALRSGGFVDDPATAPHWELPGVSGYTTLMIVLKGSDLLQGVNATHAAIGLEIEGPVDVSLWLANSEGQGRLPDSSQECCLPGNGQLVHVRPQLIQGESHVSWATTGTGIFRSSLGLVNPNPEPLQVTVFAAMLGPGAGGPFALQPWQWSTTSTFGPLVVTLPPWGWIQVDDLFHHMPCLYVPLGGLCPPPEQLTLPIGPGVLVLRPATSAPYYAYESLIYSPKSGPEFIVATPGALERAPF